MICSMSTQALPHKPWQATLFVDLATMYWFYTVIGRGQADTGLLHVQVPSVMTMCS